MAEVAFAFSSPVVLSVYQIFLDKVCGILREVCIKKRIKKLINKLIKKLIKKLIECGPDLDSEQVFNHLYRMSIKMIAQGHDYPRHLFKKHRQSIGDYILSEVLPPLSVQQAEPFLRALIQWWSSQKKMIERRPYLFLYLEAVYIPRNGLAPLKETGLTCFRDLLYPKIKRQAKNAVIALIKKEDAGEQNDRNLIKCVLDIFAENGLDQLDCIDFEDFFLKVITDFYVKAQNWILKDSHSDHMIETGEYLKLEEGRVSHYLYINCNEHKLLEETLNLMFAQLLVEEPSKCFAFLRDNRVEELCKMHKLFRNIRRLPKLCNIFKMHLSNQVTCLISQAEYSARNKEVVLWEIVELHVKHAIHVMKCFQDDTLFLKALRASASRIFSTELPATIFENSIMNSCGSGNLCKQAKEVYQEIKGKVNDMLKYLINEQLMRTKILVGKNILEGEKILEGENILEGEKISMALLSKFLDMFSNIEPDCYVADFVVPLLKSITDFYSEKAPLLFRENPPPNVYMEKVEVFSELEIERSRQYSPFAIKHIILKDVTYVLLARYLEALLRGNKVEDLSRMYIHALDICGLPESIADMLKMHLTNEITVLVRQAAQDFHSNKKKYSEVNYIQPKEEEAFAAQVQDFLWKILDLHDKYGNLITKYFGGHAAFREALTEVFELVCTGGVSGISGAELFAICCENILKCLTKKLSDQDGASKKLNGDIGPYEDALDKITRLIPYNRDKDLFVKFYSDKLERRLQGCFAILLDARVKCLHRLYTLFSKISGGLKPLVDMFKKHLMSKIRDMIEREEDPVNKKRKNIFGMWQKDLVCKIIDLYEIFEARAMECFQDHRWFCKALKEAFGDLCTRGVSGLSMAELLATFCDNILKKGCNEKLSNEDITGDVDKIVKMLACINDKVLFVEFYRKKLARRLLSNVSVCYAQESWFLEKLDQQCGGLLTSKMKRMIADITISRDNENKFKEVVDAHPYPEMDLSVSVLTAGLWPRMTNFDMNLPAEMVKYVEVFTKFYETITENAKLKWLYSEGTCNVNAKFEVGDIELIVTTSQAALLLLFNESDRLSYSEMVTELKLRHDVAMPLFHSLCCGRYKILNKEPANGSISRDDVFEFNSKFTIRMKCIKIPPPRDDTKNVVVENVQKDRGYQIDASVVRIMKSRKVMAHEFHYWRQGL